VINQVRHRRIAGAGSDGERRGLDEKAASKREFV
jgi:hypothetical protein